MFTEYMEQQAEMLTEALDMLHRFGDEMAELDMGQIAGPQKDPMPGDVFAGHLSEDLSRLLALLRKTEKAHRKFHQKVNPLSPGSMMSVTELTEEHQDFVEREEALRGLLYGSIREEYGDLIQHLAILGVGLEPVFCSDWRLFIRPVRSGSQPGGGDHFGDIHDVLSQILSDGGLFGGSIPGDMFGNDRKPEQAGANA